MRTLPVDFWRPAVAVAREALRDASRETRTMCCFTPEQASERTLDAEADGWTVALCETVSGVHLVHLAR